MAKKKSLSVSDLRKRAEEKVGANEARTPDMTSPEETQRLIHELRVHQSELEMQNEELRRTQAELEVSRARYFDLYDLSPVGYLTINEKGLILEANITLAGLLGTERRALVEQPLTRFILPEDQDLYYLHRKKLFATSVPQSFDIRFLRAGDAPFWARIDAAALQNADGVLECRAVLKDIGERRLTEQKALHLASFPQLNPNPVLELDVSGNIIFINPSAQKTLEDLGMNKGDARAFLPADLVAFLRGWDKKSETILYREILIKNRIFGETFQLLPQFNLMRIYAIDITERKVAEEAVQKSESRYRDLVQNANSAIIRWQRDGSVIFFNEYAQQFFGYGEEEIIGRNVSILIPERESSGTDLSGLIQAIVEHPERFVNNVNENVLRDGRRVWMAWTNKPIFDEQGQVVEILAVATDITELKLVEDALRANNEELERLNRAMVGRELRMIELKKEVNELCFKAGLQPPYKMDFGNE